MWRHEPVDPHVHEKLTEIFHVAVQLTGSRSPKTKAGAAAIINLVRDALGHNRKMVHGDLYS